MGVSCCDRPPQLARISRGNRAESRRDFVHKVAIVEKEAAESLYWIELFEEAMIGDRRTNQTLVPRM